MAIEELETTEFIPESNAEPFNLDRLIDTSRSMAKRAINFPIEYYQTVTSFPYPKGDTGIDDRFINEHLRQSTLRHAQRDNRMIDRNIAKITEYEDRIADNIECGNYSQLSLDNENSHIYSQIKTLRDDINLLKTTKTTADDIDSHNRGDDKKSHQAANSRLF